MHHLAQVPSSATPLGRVAGALVLGSFLLGSGCLLPGPSGSDPDPGPGGGDDTGDGSGDPSSGPMIAVPAGPFWMGCDEGDAPSCYPESRPRHEVDVPAFEIDTYEVTVAAYQACEDDGACSPTYESSFEQCNGGRADRADHPINCTDAFHAEEYCAWAGKRLCSEAEWEKAARGADGGAFPWGDATATCDEAVLDDGAEGCGLGFTQPVGSLPDGASVYGVMDLAGNVGEWVADECYRNYADTPSDGSPWTGGSFQIYRGGGFRQDADRQALWIRYCGSPSFEQVDVGIRCCR